MRELKPRPPGDEPRNGAARTPKFRIARGRNRVVGWVNRIIAGIRELRQGPFGGGAGLKDVADVTKQC
jgi:hypothetical protein